MCEVLAGSASHLRSRLQTWVARSATARRAQQPCHSSLSQRQFGVLTAHLEGSLLVDSLVTCVKSLRWRLHHHCCISRYHVITVTPHTHSDTHSGVSPGCARREGLEAEGLRKTRFHFVESCSNAYVATFPYCFRRLFAARPLPSMPPLPVRSATHNTHISHLGRIADGCCQARRKTHSSRPYRWCHEDRAYRDTAAVELMPHGANRLTPGQYICGPVTRVHGRVVSVVVVVQCGVC